LGTGRFEHLVSSRALVSQPRLPPGLGVVFVVPPPGRVRGPAGRGVPAGNFGAGALFIRAPPWSLCSPVNRQQVPAVAVRWLPAPWF